jgi:ribosomal-protein-alanine N-acetyltransferase
LTRLFETPRLFLRHFEPDDAEELHTVFGDPKVMERIPGGPSPSLQETRRRLMKIIEHQQKHGFSLWAIVEKNSGKLIGDCGLILVEGRGPEIEISYDIAYEFWGRGYATEAASRCLRFGIEQLKLKRVIGLTYADHIASRRVMENSGMVYEKRVERYSRELVQYTTNTLL